MVLDPVRNFAIGVLKTGISAGDTSITLQEGQGDKFPSTSEGSYNCVIWNATDYTNPADDPNKEMVRVASRSGDTFTVQRGQEGTSAVAHNTSGKTYKMMLVFSRKSYDDINTQLERMDNLGGDLSNTIDNATVETVGGKSASEVADAVNKRHAQNTDRLIKSADGNTSVDTEASAEENKIRFKTAGSERAVIDNNGKVGVGKDSPEYELDVNGAVNATTYYGDGSNLAGLADEKVKADSGDSTSGYLDAKVDNSTIEVANHKIRVKDGSISQTKLKAATGSVSFTTSGANVTEASNELTLPGGSYGFYPRIKYTTTGIWGGCAASLGGKFYESYDTTQPQVHGMEKRIIAGSTSYKTSITLMGYAHSYGNTTVYAQQRYITSSGKDHWIFLLVAKKDILDRDRNLIRKKGDLISSYEAPDHPATNNEGDLVAIPHPFGDYDPEKHEIAVVDNDILYEARKRISSKRGLLEVINEDFVIDDWQRPKFEPREIIMIDEFGDLESEEIKRMKTPQWAKIMIQPEEISLKRKIVEKLPDFILYKKMRLKEELIKEGKITRRWRNGK